MTDAATLADAGATGVTADAEVESYAVVDFPPELAQRFTTAREVADAVLFEGYVLYPYRASAAKNHLRWQFGVLVPPAYGTDSAEPAHQQAECLIEPRAGDRLAVEVRFLRVQHRTVQRAAGQGANRTFETVSELELPDRILVPWDEGVVEQVRLVVPVEQVADGVRHPFVLPASHSEQDVTDGAGRVVGRLARERQEVRATVRLTARPLPGPYGALRLTAAVENTSPWRPGAGARRADALPHALVSAHLLLALDRGSFLSVTGPPRWAAGAVAELRNEHVWPVLAGADGRADAVLCSPIVLEDHPRLAPESPGALYDATEIDEILALRTTALTDREKREARGTDERAGAAVDLADSLPAEVWERLHGAVRALREATGPDAAADGEGRALPWWDPGGDRDVDPARDRVVIDGTSVGAGSRVRLGPGRRRTDAQDLFLHGRTGVVEAVLHDVDGSVHLAVTVDDDPGADLWRLQGRFRYFQPDELTPLGEA